MTSLVKNLSKEERFKLAILLSGSFCLVEAIAGYWANSLAVLSDASHLLTDVAGFAIALLAALASKMPATNSFTYGFKQAELLGAIASVTLLYMLTSYLVIEAISRSIQWYENKMDAVDGKTVFFISMFGVFVNLILGLVFHDEHGGAFHPAHSHEHDHESGGGCDHHHNRDDLNLDHDHKLNNTSYEAISGKSEHCSGHDHEHVHDSQHHIEDDHTHHDNDDAHADNDDHDDGNVNAHMVTTVIVMIWLIVHKYRGCD
jgi:zinc transporter 2